MAVYIVWLRADPPGMQVQDSGANGAGPVAMLVADIDQLVRQAADELGRARHPLRRALVGRHLVGGRILPIAGAEENVIDVWQPRSRQLGVDVLAVRRHDDGL